jgi:membrane associated rhomboid family serine protease
MSWQDRHYNQDDFAGGPASGGGGGFSNRLTRRSVVTWLLVINLVVFLWEGVFAGSTRGGVLSISEHAYFSVERALYSGQVWRLLTYQFIHAGLLHIFFNMLALFYFGPLIEGWWGPRRFLAFYLICGISGALVATLLGAIPGANILDPYTPVVGASGAIFGILVACAMLFPHQRVMLLFPPIPMTMRTLALVFLGIAALSVLAGSANAGGEATHLGGALMGFLLTRYPASLRWADRISPAAIQAGVNDKRWQRKLDRQRQDEAELDRILAKVKEHGLHALSATEKRKLQRATDRRRTG